MRVVVLLGIALAAFLVMGDIGSILPRRSLRPQAVDSVQESASAPGWPSRRGPRRDGVSDEAGLADQWPAEGPPVLWTRELGRGYSGLIAVGDRVYTQTQSISAQSVVCLDADTGQTVWEHRYGWPYEAAGMYPGPRSTPTWHDGRIYYATPRGAVGCLRASDGSPLWELDFNEKFNGRGTDFGYSCSPVIEDGKLLLPIGGPGASLVALNPRDGSTVWASGDEPASYSSALPITLDGRPYVVALLQNAVSIFELDSGRLMWQ
ncbi:MAG TPA: PQQ-binding-like beta-propeller repeat protein, partial [Thermoguttaceae bacterium]|nr:PQQ-binding-like beta-propeller repeat protein [Thermoguttaceae bacterium]